LDQKNYNFGELLEHPILEALKGSSHEWLGAVLTIFNKGDIHAWIQFQQAHQSILNNVSELVKNIPLLEVKIAIMCLINYSFSLGSKERNVPLSNLSHVIGKPVDEIEVLLMKTMSLGFIRGQIDQVAGDVYIEWVQPRVLNLDQIEVMGKKFSHWIENVDTVLAEIESNLLS